MKIYCDSSTKEACLVFVNDKKRSPMTFTYATTVTNNVGEYQAVIMALETVWVNKYKEVEILTDSLLVVNQVKAREEGGWKCRSPHLLPYIKRAGELIRETGAKLSWIPREENLAGRLLG